MAKLYDILKAEKTGLSDSLFTAMLAKKLSKPVETVKELEDTPPLSFTGNGEPLINWSIDGASGGVGDKTANLFDKDNPNIFKGYYNTTINTLLTTENNAFIYVPLVQGKKYYVYGCKRSNPSTTIRWVTISSTPFYNIPCIRTGVFEQTDIFTITAETNENYLAIFVCGDSDYSAYGTVEAAVTANCADLVIDNGYNIPVTCGGETNTIYLDAPLGASDSISMTDTSILIPTVDGSNTLSVGTTVQPSSVYIKYKE